MYLFKKTKIPVGYGRDCTGGLNLRHKYTHPWIPTHTHEYCVYALNSRICSLMQNLRIISFISSYLQDINDYFAKLQSFALYIYLLKYRNFQLVFHKLDVWTFLEIKFIMILYMYKQYLEDLISNCDIKVYENKLLMINLSIL